ncbi:MAG: hypothetical protein WA116_08525 [Anaerolineaceae bacterium]
MKLLPEWKKIARRAWSFRLSIIAALLSGAEVVLPLFIDVLPRNLFASLSFVAVVGAAIARVVAQPRMHEE